MLLKTIFCRENCDNFYMSVDTNIKQRINQVFSSKANSKDFDECVDKYIKEGMNEAVAWYMVIQPVHSNTKKSDFNDLEQLSQKCFMILRR